ncbi:MAG TPA: hypothetical protein PKX91_02645 [Clostridia bacterium]|nr:hypothetical protein [Clostridia bacterium]
MRKNKPIFLIIVTIVAFCLLFIIACKPPVIDDGKDKPVEEETINDGLIVPNGRFANVGSTSSKRYVQSTVTGWTAKNGSKSTTVTGIEMGIIDLDGNKFEANKGFISDFDSYPGVSPSTPKEEGVVTDTNALLLSIPGSQDAGSIYFTSGDVTVQKNTHYLLSIDVYTDIQKPEGNSKTGAAICITDGAFVEFLSIDTNKTWDVYSIYIKGNNFEDRKFQIQLWLGHGPAKIGSDANPYLANGVVLYDNVVLTKIEQEEYENVTETVSNQQKTTDENGNVQTRLDLTFPDPAMTQYTAYDATTTYAMYTKHYYSAKKGASPNYKFFVGKSDLSTTDKDDFGNEGITYNESNNSTFPLGVFDMSKLYSFNEEGHKNIYATIYEDFKAPPHEDFYKQNADLSWVYAIEGKDGNSGRVAESSHDTNALLIYHPKNKISGAGFQSKKKLEIEKNTYYKLSVWVYIWIPEMAEPKLKEGDESDPAKVSKYEEEMVAYNKYLEYYDGSKNVSATFRLTGASISNEAKLEAKSKIGWDGETGGKWEELTLKIKGNELSARQVNIEFWYGEGKLGDDTLYPGACFFDDLTIEKYTEETVDNPNDFYQLSALQQGDYKLFGLIDNDPVSNSDFTALVDSKTLWKHKVEDARTSKEDYSVGIIGGNSNFINSTEPSTTYGLEGLSCGPETIKILYNGQETALDVFMINHIKPTASSAEFVITDETIAANPEMDKLLKVNPNSFYRLSMWVKTVGFSKDKAATIEIKPSTGSALATYKNIYNEDWLELVLYVQGRAVDWERLSIKVTLGSGDIYNPDEHRKGSFFLTAMVWQKIEYTEYKGAVSSNSETSIPRVEKRTISESSTTPSPTITNGFFQQIDSSNYDDEKLFDAEGNLIGVAKPSSWNKNEAKATLKTPAPKLSDDHKTLSWDAVDKATKYFVFMDGYKENEAAKLEDDVLLAVTTDKEYQIKCNGSYYVRAVGGVEGMDRMFSAKSTAQKVTKITGGVMPAKYDGVDKDWFDIKAGVVNYMHYEGFNQAEKDDMYGKPEEGFYKSIASDNLMYISSELDTFVGYTMSGNHPASKDKYYLVSVWVKTIGNAKASITLKDPSSTLALTEYENSNFAVNGEHVGFVNIDTNNEWVQYRFLVKPGFTEGKITIELYLGNRYAEEISSGEGDGNIKYSQGLSRGTVLFDDINVEEIESLSNFNLQAYGFEDPTSVDKEDYLKEDKRVEPYGLKEKNEFTNSYYNNKYVFKIVELKTDSFDNYTEATDDYNGHTPGAYTHRDATDATSYKTPTEGDEDTSPAMLYGVYNTRRLTDKVIEYLVKTGFEEAEVRQFLQEDTGNGANFLLMANIVDNGQLYEFKSGFDVAANTYYKITFTAKALVPEGKSPEFRFIYGNDTTKWSTVKIDSQNKKEYEFYIFNEDESSSVSNNKISFHIGTNDGIRESIDTKNFFKGILVVDDVTISKLESNEATVTLYEGKDPSLKYSFEAKEAKEKEGEDEDKEEEESKKEVDPQLWLLVSSVVIGAILLITVIVLIVRRVGKRMAKNKKVVIQSKLPVDGPVKEKAKATKHRQESQEIDKFDD